jgi:hypothetical protein
MRSLQLLKLALVLLVLPTSQWADIIFSNLSGPDGGYTVCGDTSKCDPASESLAVAFTPSLNYLMTDAKVEVFNDGPYWGDPYFNLSLFSDANGVPGVLLAKIGTRLEPPADSGVNFYDRLVTVYIIAGGHVRVPTLDAGKEDWLVLTPFDSDSFLAWEIGGTSSVPAAVTISPTGEGGWRTYFSNQDLQLQIDGTPVPEPGTFFLLGTCLLGFIGLRLGRK